ncbi:tRNA nucleotidyltransferase [Peptoniphilus sp. oral taxon 386 str. F0131]|nr:ribonuclease PH [Peptoniphilus sp. oral taxon 386]EFI42360.1 tRNA nucleotidyltransferase [Peptoniphilus sp. oral taxon 386 str. F0131]
MRDNRKFDEMRNIELELNYTSAPDGSVLIKCGNTKVICTAMIEDKVPFFLKGKNSGWLSCEYSMLPGSTSVRKVRDISRGKLDGRSQEIQRLIGRSLRSCVDLSKIGEKTIWIDCDVISADGGTRTTSINGSFIALSLAVKNAIRQGIILENPIKNKVAAISVGIVENEKLLDLNYDEDSNAQVDLNVVMNDNKEIIEIQGTAEGRSFSRKELNELIDLSEIAIDNIFNIQNKVLLDKEKIVLSSDNEHKITEIKEILKDLPVEIISKKDVNLSNINVDENLDTLEGNAHLKASAIKDKCAYSVIADDTGLFVNALNGEPGVHSARYAKSHDDVENRKLLIKNLRDEKDRRAYFKTVIVYIDSIGEEHIFEGICKGEITEKEIGNGGFGYDSIFLPKGFNRTFGEMSSDEKNLISHRSEAIKKFKDFLMKKYSDKIIY